jgi:hypothetical protein
MNHPAECRSWKDEVGNVEGCIPACASSVVELWFAIADFPKGAVGADVVTKAALVALLLDLQFAVWEKRHRDFAVTCSFRHERSDIVLDRRFA